MTTRETLSSMARPYSKVAELRTSVAEDADWDIVEGFAFPFAPDVILPVALMRNREYRFVWNPATHAWDVYSRGSTSQGEPDD